MKGLEALTGLQEGPKNALPDGTRYDRPESGSSQVACSLSGIWFLFLPFFKRDFRLKKRSKCPSWQVPGALPHALSRPRVLRSSKRSEEP